MCVLGVRCVLLHVFSDSIFEKILISFQLSFRVGESPIRDIRPFFSNLIVCYPFSKNTFLNVLRILNFACLCDVTEDTQQPGPQPLLSVFPAAALFMPLPLFRHVQSPTGA